MKNVQKIDAIPDNPRYNDKEPTNAEVDMWLCMRVSISKFLVCENEV